MNIKRRVVLIAEDDRALAQALRLRLERAGFMVYVAYDQEQARILAARQRYELIIADFDSTTLNGVEFCRHIREELGLVEVPIAVCHSGKDDIEMGNLVYRFAITRLLDKPVDPETIVELAWESVNSQLAAI